MDIKENRCLVVAENQWRVSIRYPGTGKQKMYVRSEAKVSVLCSSNNLFLLLHTSMSISSRIFVWKKI